MALQTKLYKSDYAISKKLLEKMEVVDRATPGIRERIIKDIAKRIIDDMPLAKVKELFNFTEEEQKSLFSIEGNSNVKFTMSVEL